MRTSTLALAFLLGVGAQAAQDFAYDIGNKRIEGIHIVYGDKLGLTADVLYALVSETYYGGIKAIDPQTGELAKQAVPSNAFKERGGLGMTYHDGMILAAGGGNLFRTPAEPAGMYVYDAITGSQIAECLPEFDTSAMLMNDAVVIGEKAYWSLSFSNKIPVMDIATNKAGKCSIEYIDLPIETFPADGETLGMNGIIPYDSDLLISYNTNGGIYFVDLSDGNAMSEALPTGSLTNPDGMVAVNNKVYVAELGGNQLSEMTASSSVDSTGKKAVKLSIDRAINSEFYNNPATVDIDSDIIFYAVNVRAYLPGLGLLAEGKADPSTVEESFHIVGNSRVQTPTSDTLLPEEPAVNTPLLEEPSSGAFSSSAFAIGASFIVLSAFI